MVHSVDVPRSCSSEGSFMSRHPLLARLTAHVLEGLPAFWDGSDADRDAVLTILADAEPIFNGLTYFTADYRDHGRSNFDPAVGRLDFSSRGYAREVVTSGQLAVSDETVVGLA